MFKKIASILLAAIMVGSTAVVAASAAEADNAVAAADDSAVAAADDSAVAAADDSAVAAGDDSTVGAGNKIYFEVNPDLWKNFRTVTLYLYPHGGDALITWGSKKGNMKDEGGNKWSFDFVDKGIEIESGKQYGMIFTGDWGVQTCDIIWDSSVMGDTAYCTGDQVENNVDSNKKSYYVKWKNADASKYAPPVCITSIGNIIGEALWSGTTYYDMLVNFIKSDGSDGLSNALKYNGKNAQQTLDDIAKQWGLSQDDIEKAIKEAGKEGQVDWKKSNSSASESSNSGSGSSSNSGSSSSSSSGSSSSSSSSKTSGTGSVTSGEGDTLIFLFGGIMLAAAGVVFLARKRRED
nr:LPXTG cell wall anchor domain-containing protein [uncultured Ruminococcus sp.]